MTELTPFNLTAEQGFRPTRVVQERQTAAADLAKELGL